MKESAELILVGVEHHAGNFRIVRNNYKTVKDFLVKTKPGFVTAEVRFGNEPGIWMLGKSLFYAGLDRLTEMDESYLQQAQYTGEYAAAIIYCRINNVPLFFVDLYNFSPEEVASLDITELSKTTPELIWDESRDVSPDVMRKMYDLDERNVFMARAINEVSRRMPAKTGVHIGGSAHYDPEESKITLQSLLNNPRIKIVNI